MESRGNSIVERSKSGLITTRSDAVYANRGRTPSLGESAHVDFENAARYFMGFWRAPHAAKAMSTLERYESKRMLKALRMVSGIITPRKNNDQ